MLEYKHWLSEALSSLVPGAGYCCYGTEYKDIEWRDERPKPSKAEVDVEISRLQKQWEYTEYQRKRALEYPDVREYFDGIVKGDQEQIQAYIDACLAVKAKYPKPEGV